MVRNTHPRLWTRWRRGFSVLWRVCCILYAAYFVFYLGGAVLETLGQPWRAIVGVVVGLPVLAAVVILLPVIVSSMQLDAASIRDEVATEIEPRIDAIAESLGIDWDQHDVSQIGQLVESGDSVGARQAYQDHSGATWDEVDQAIANWRVTVMKCKLTALQQAIDGRTEA